MKYELAKKLKDDGFPIKDYPDCEIGNCFVNKHEHCYPTLSELIETCGDRFEWLVVDDIQINDKYGMLTATKKNKDGWLCGDRHATIDDDAGLRIHGATPEEAVANLWLALNEKNAQRT